MKDRYAAIVSTIALLVALTSAGAFAASQLGKDSVGARQIKAGAVKGPEIHKKAVGTSDIVDGGVQAQDLTLPSPASFDIATGAATPPTGVDEFTKLATAGTYEKQDGTAVLSVNWSGLVGSKGVPCFFEVRVDGVASEAAPLYVDPQTTLSVSTQTLFPGLAAGPHDVEIWAHSQSGGSDGMPFTCSLGASGVDVGQTIVVQELVI